MYFVYLLHCRDGSLYAGMTNDLEKRLAAHKAGTASRYTRSRGALRFAYTESVGSRSDALKREALIKRMSHAAKLAMIREARRVGKSPRMR